MCLHATRSPIKKTLVALERREDQRTAFLNDLEPYLTRPERLVFLDESGFQTNMTRGSARAPRHLRAVCASPRNHGQNQSLICALSLAGPLAPLVIDGSLNGEVFEWSVREELCPVLVAGQVVILDNLSSHHLASIRTLIEARGCTLLYLSPYSPDFNPIELLFSKLKALVRGEAPRTIPKVIANIGKSRVRGLELESEFQVSREWLMNFAYTHLDAKILDNIDPDYINYIGTVNAKGKYLPGVPANTVSVAINCSTVAVLWSISLPKRSVIFLPSGPAFSIATLAPTEL